MSSEPGPSSDGATLAADEARLAELAEALTRRVEASLESWVLHAVQTRLEPETDPSVRQGAERAAVEAGSRAQVELSARLRELLSRDIDDQHTNPLAILRTVVDYVTPVLASADVPPTRRDQDAQRLHPDDVYDLTPGGFVDFGPDVHEAGMMWGAGKAHVHLRRRRAANPPDQTEGRR